MAGAAGTMAAVDTDLGLGEMEVAMVPEAAEAELAEGEEDDDGIDHALEYLLRGIYMSRL